MDKNKWKGKNLFGTRDVMLPHSKKDKVASFHNGISNGFSSSSEVVKDDRVRGNEFRAGPIRLHRLGVVMNEMDDGRYFFSISITYDSNYLIKI